MDLRPPPSTAPSRPPADPLTRGLLVLVVLLVAALGTLLLMRPGGAGGDPEAAARTREVASKLLAAGAPDEAARLYARYLETSGEPAEVKAKIAYSVGATYLERGRYEEALRWFYEAESLGAGELTGELARELGGKIVHALEALGRLHAARAALGSRAGAPQETDEHAAGDPVVARIGERQVHRSEVERALDDLPPELARVWADPSRRPGFLRQWLAEELLWQKAVRMEYDDDPQVRRRHEAMLRQLAVGRYLDEEVVGKIAADEADLATFFEANQERYQAPPESEGGEPRPLSFEEARPLVERDYRLYKAQAATSQAVEAELAAGDVEIFEEAWTDG